AIRGIKTTVGPSGGFRPAAVTLTNNTGNQAWSDSTGAVMVVNDTDVVTVTGNTQPVTPSSGMVFLKATGSTSVTQSNNSIGTTTPTGTPPVQCAVALQALIDATTTGGTCNVPFGEYRETVNVSRAMTISFATGCIVNGQGTRQKWMNITASNVTVRLNSSKFMDCAAGAYQTGSLDISASNVKIIGPGVSPGVCYAKIPSSLQA